MFAKAALTITLFGVVGAGIILAVVLIIIFSRPKASYKCRRCSHAFESRLESPECPDCGAAGNDLSAEFTRFS